jgi:hypothetical protein
MTASKPAVVWSTLAGPGSEPPTAEGLRERKKRLLRQQLSDTATQMCRRCSAGCGQRSIRLAYERALDLQLYLVSDHHSPGFE